MGLKREMTGEASRCGFAAIIGAPNAGKSTLVNSLVGSKVSIVTHKVQTTRAVVRGIALHGSAQIVFVDTPGIFSPRRRLDRAMVEAAWSGVADADATVVVVDVATYLSELSKERRAEPSGGKKGAFDTNGILQRLGETVDHYILVLNKIDLIPRTELLRIIDTLREQHDPARVMLTSAMTGDGVSDLKSTIAELMPSGPWLYPEDQLADIPQRLLASEITRESLMLRLHEELPYDSTVETESWTLLKDKSVRVEQVIYVRRKSQRAIVLGKKGEVIKAIGSAARRELEKILGMRVHLFLVVKVREKWLDEPARYRELGLEFPKS